MRKVIKTLVVLMYSFIVIIGCNINANTAENTIKYRISHLTPTIKNSKIEINIPIITKQTIKNHTPYLKTIQTCINEFLQQQNIEEVEYEEEIEEYFYEEDEVEEEQIVEIYEVYNYSPRLYEPDYFELMGILEWNGWRWTWYSQQVLPGGGLDIPGRYVDEDGYVCDINGYICLASDLLDKGTVVDTPFGKPGCVYDCGPGALDVLDVYVDW